MKYTSEQIGEINKSINVVDYASKYLDLEHKNDEYWCVCPFHDDINASLSFNREKNSFYCFGCQASGSTIQFIMKYHKFSFPKTIEYILKYANITLQPKEYSETMEFLHRQVTKKKQKDIIRTYLPNDIMNQYTREPIKEWLAEGISQQILDEYEVRYNKQGNAIVFPIRDIAGRILAVKARTLYPNFRDLGIPKYIYYQSIGTNDFLFGLYRNKPFIQSTSECLIFESEKSVMKLNSWGINNCVATSTKKISDKQVELLLSLKCNLVFAFDKDVDRKEVLNQIKLFSRFTNTYYTYDRNDLLGVKDAPCDKGKDVWLQLYNEKYKL